MRTYYTCILNIYEFTVVSKITIINYNITISNRNKINYNIYIKLCIRIYGIYV